MVPQSQIYLRGHGIVPMSAEQMNRSDGTPVGIFIAIGKYECIDGSVRVQLALPVRCFNIDRYHGLYLPVLATLPS